PATWFTRAGDLSTKTAVPSRIRTTLTLLRGAVNAGATEVATTRALNAEEVRGVLIIIKYLGVTVALLYQ
ncbi:MAG: hypothetical protein ACKO7Z_11720, partial [Cyanobacteriota bacterium]